MMYYVHTANTTFLCHVSIQSLYGCSYSYSICWSIIKHTIHKICMVHKLKRPTNLNTYLYWAWKYTVQLLAIYIQKCNYSGTFENGINLFAFLRKQNNIDIFKSTITLSTLLNLCLICTCTADVQAHFILWSWTLVEKSSLINSNMIIKCY